MSSRNFRKVNKHNNLPPPPDDSDDDYQPLYAQKSGFSNYAGLEVGGSSHSESDRASERSEDETRNNAWSLPPEDFAPKKKNKKKGKGKAKVPAAGFNELDEVERSVMEVNAILGNPPPAPIDLSVNNPALDVLVLDPKHLNVSNELRRIFGPDDNVQNRRARTQNRALLLRRVLIHPNKETPVYNYHNSGWSMMKYKESGDRSHFVFNHSDEYQKMHRMFLRRLAVSRSTNDIVANFEEAKEKMHVEALLEISDRLFRMEENSTANEIVENVVTFLQYVADSLFILSKNNVRLEYKFLENRPFHVAMLKYIYLLTNKACHRTALEIAKMLLLIDPRDPLAIVSVMDILALRCREHEWLIESINYFERQREATLLFNIKYSFGLAHFHVALKKNYTFVEADRLIREAILAFPHIFVKIMECSNQGSSPLLGHELFKPDPPIPWSLGAAEVYMVYAKLTFPRWNEPKVMKWLTRNATELIRDYEIDEEIRDTANNWAISRRTLYQVWPEEYLRHMAVFAPMSKLIIDMPLTAPPFLQPTCAFDPLYHKCVNRYEYSYKWDAPAEPSYSTNPGAPGASAVFSHHDASEYFVMLNIIRQHNSGYPVMYQPQPAPGAMPLFDIFTPIIYAPNQIPNEAMQFYVNARRGARPRSARPGQPQQRLQQRPQQRPQQRLQQRPNRPAEWRLFNRDLWQMQAAHFQAMFGPHMPVGVPVHFVAPYYPNYPLFCRHWAFNDNDPAFEHYDYSDDEYNFVRDERAMAEAVATDGPDVELERMAAAIDAICLDRHFAKVFKPKRSNAKTRLV